jgi:hypothetical protein
MQPHIQAFSICSRPACMRGSQEGEGTADHYCVLVFEVWDLITGLAPRNASRLSGWHVQHALWDSMPTGTTLGPALSCIWGQV